MINKIFLALTFIFVIGIIVVLLIFGKKGDEAKNTQTLDNLNITTNDQSSLKETYVRKMWAAGQFYPKDPSELKTKLDGLFVNTGILPKEGKLRILVVPHAGVDYSGQTAAWGFAQIKDKNYSKVIIIASDHKNPINHVAVMDSGEWETPFGNIAIDEDLAQRILDNQKIISDPKEHEGQHVIEIETVFLKYLLKDFKIVPILVGSDLPDGTIKDLAFNISKNMDDNTLLIISSDLSHYPNYDDSQVADKNIVDAFLTLEPEKLLEASIQNQQKNIANLETSACGLKAMETALYIADLTNIKDFTLINNSNSGDFTEDKNRVVGYAAIGGWSINAPSIQLNEETQKELLVLARNTINGLLNNQNLGSYTPVENILNYPLGAFVTLREDGMLRGCIGEFEPKDPLYRVVQNTAISSASKDPRFSPITKNELNNIKIEVSVLSPLRKIGNWQDIIIGKNGVKIQIGNKSGTFLPQVATDENWDLVTFLENLCMQKMSLSKNCYQDKNAQIYVYDAQVFEE